DWRREVAVLSIAGGNVRGENRNCGFAADRADAGPDGTADTNGHSRGGAEQLALAAGTEQGLAAGDRRRNPGGICFAGTVGSRRYGAMVEAGADRVLRDRRSALHF